MTRRDRIIMMKRETPNRVTLIKDRTLAARHKRVTRAYLPANTRLRQPYKKRAVLRGRRHRQIAIQQRRGFGSNILKFAKKIVKTPFVQEFGKMTLNELPNLYNKGANKIKNKKTKKLLQFDNFIIFLKRKY